jgi:hypothetical protein
MAPFHAPLSHCPESSGHNNRNRQQSLRPPPFYLAQARLAINLFIIDANFPIIQKAEAFAAAVCLIYQFAASALAILLVHASSPFTHP